MGKHRWIFCGTLLFFPLALASPARAQVSDPIAQTDARLAVQVLLGAVRADGQVARITGVGGRGRACMDAVVEPQGLGR